MPGHGTKHGRVLRRQVSPIKPLHAGRQRRRLKGGGLPILESPPQASHQLGLAIVEAAFVSLRRYQLRIREATRQDRERSRRHRFYDSDSEKLVYGGRNHNVGLSQELQIGLSESGPKVDDALPKSRSGRKELLGVLPLVLATDRKPEIDSERIKGANGPKEQLGALCVLPTVIPEQQRQAVVPAVAAKELPEIHPRRQDPALFTQCLDRQVVRFIRPPPHHGGQARHELVAVIPRVEQRQVRGHQRSVVHERIMQVPLPQLPAHRAPRRTLRQGIGQLILVKIDDGGDGTQTRPRNPQETWPDRTCRWPRSGPVAASAR